MSVVVSLSGMRRQVRRAFAQARVAFSAGALLPRAALADVMGVREMLGAGAVNLSEATQIALAADRHFARFLTAAQALHGKDLSVWLAQSESPLARMDALLLSLRNGPIVLAVPLHLSMLALLGHASAERFALQIERTPLTELLLSRLLVDGAAPSSALLSERELMLRARTQTTERSLWVTFPDHAVAPEGARYSATLCGQPHYFSTLELVLASRLGAAVWTLDVEADHGLYLRPCEWTPQARRMVEPREADRLYGDIGGAMTRVLAQSSASVLSWSRIARNRESVIRGRQLRAVATMRELLFAWSEATPGAAPPMHLVDALAAAETMFRAAPRATSRDIGRT